MQNLLIGLDTVGSFPFKRQKQTENSNCFNSQEKLIFVKIHGPSARLHCDASLYKPATVTSVCPQRNSELKHLPLLMHINPQREAVSMETCVTSPSSYGDKTPRTLHIKHSTHRPGNLLERQRTLIYDLSFFFIFFIYPLSLLWSHKAMWKHLWPHSAQGGVRTNPNAYIPTDEPLWLHHHGDRLLWPKWQQFGFRFSAVTKHQSQLVALIIVLSRESLKSFHPVAHGYWAGPLN